MVDTMEQMSGDALSSMANAAVTLRKAIAAALPVASTQLMTMQVPGLVINPDDYTWNRLQDPFRPLSVRINEAKLVDNQVPVSKIMMGRTGKSVARSYLSTLDCLVSIESAISTALASDKPLNARQQGIRDRYTTAMTYLTSEDPGNKGRSRLQTYVKKQEQWNAAVKDFNKAQADQVALHRDEGTVEQKRQAFLEWMQANGRDFKATIQARYMDWVVHGYKFDIEFNFGVVDVSSAMKRIETSKEAYRNLTLLAEDGASEYAGVNLTPSNWADTVKKTVEDWGKRHKGPSPLEIRAEIKRLTNLKISHTALLESVKEGKFIPHQYSTALATGDGTLKQGYQDVYGRIQEKEAEKADEKSHLLPKPTGQFDPTIFKSSADAYEEWNQAKINDNAAVIKTSSDAVKAETETYLNGRISVIDAQIRSLELMLVESSHFIPGNNAQAAPLPVFDHTGKTVDEEDLQANPNLLQNPNLTDAPSAWTRITAKVSKLQSESSKFASESSTSGGMSSGWWFWHANASASHSESSAQATSEISNLDIEISMDCMLVEIERPWLHAELFADHELDAAPGFKISPGPIELQRSADDNRPVLTDYTMFSSYSNAFVIACNVEIEFTGDTSKLETALEASSTEGNTSIGIGCFSIEAAHKSSKNSSKTKAESTATGMRISMQAPQIIAWVQELLPALPKASGDNAALYGLPISSSVKPPSASVATPPKPPLNTPANKTNGPLKDGDA